MLFRSRHHLIFLLAGLLLLAYALRLYRLDFQSIWWDEGISLHLGTSSIGEIIRDRQNNIHPPLYFFLLKVWLSLTGVSAFTGRYLSVLASLSQVAIVFAAVRFWGGRASDRRGFRPWLAAALVVISPLSVIYGQEIRVYAMLPLIYVAMLLLAEIGLSATGVKTRSLVLLGVVEWIGLHLHYITVIAVAYVGLWGLVSLIRGRDNQGVRRWIVMQSLVGLASLPWLVGVIGNWAAISGEANAGTYLTQPVPLRYLMAQVWAFHLTGLAGSLASRFVATGAALAAVFVAGLVIYRTIPPGEPLAAVSRQAAIARRLLAHWIVPLGVGFAIWSVRSFSHPRYIIMFAMMLIPLVAFLVSPARRHVERAAAGFLIVCLTALSIWGLRQYFFDGGAAKPDIRGAAHYLESVAGADDLILIPDTDWSFPFEYRGQATVMMPHLDEPPDMDNSTLIRALECTDGLPCARSGRVFVIDYASGTRDWQDRLTFELARRGYRLNEETFDDIRVREYRLNGGPDDLPYCDLSELPQPKVRFGSLRLDSAWVAPGAPSDTAVAVALCWRAAETVASDYFATLILRDPVTGERIAQSDVVLVDRDGAPSRYWSPNESVVTYHVLPLASGTPPIEATLSIGAYTEVDDTITAVEAIDSQDHSLGELLTLGSISLAPSVRLATSPYNVELPPQWESPVEMADGLSLLGARYSRGPYRPGQNIRVGLTWRATTDPMPEYHPVIILEQGGEILAENAEQMVNGRYPTSRWRAQEMVFEYRDVRVPAGVEGVAQLSVKVNGERVYLGDLLIESADILLDRPPVGTSVNVRFGEQITLIGYDPPLENIRLGEEVPLTLYWESLSSKITTGYAVFTHLLAEDGRLIAQHDGAPANGQRPTHEWLAGEYVIDLHNLVWRDMIYTGPARLAVGLYDPATGERLKTADGFDSFFLTQSFTVVDGAP